MLATLPRVMTWMGGLLWTCAYGFAFYTGQQSGTPAFPVPAVLLNLAWEFTFGVLSPPTARMTRFVYVSWFAVDGLLWLQLFWLAPPPELSWLPHGTYPIALVLGTTAAWMLHQCLGRVLRAPHLQAYLTNVATSSLFVWVLFARDHDASLTTTIAWLKFLGTSFITLANLQHFWRRQTTPILALICMGTVGLLDVTYLVLLYLR
jgi:hypothetical protein